MTRNFWSLSWGIILIVLGVLLILDRMGYAEFDLGRFLHTWWPLILVIVGLSMLLDDGRRKKHDRDES